MDVNVVLNDKYEKKLAVFSIYNRSMQIFRLVK